MGQTEQNKKDGFFVILFAVLLSYLTYIYVLHVLGGIWQDYNGHTYVYVPMFTGGTWVEGWKTVSYCLWHMTVLLLNKALRLPLDVSAAYAACLYSVFAYFILYWMIQKVTAAAGRREDCLKASLIAFGMCAAQSLYCFWLDAGGRFLGLYSMNPIHNPTQMCVKGFSLICLCLVWDIWQKQKDENYHGLFFKVENGLKRYYIYLSVMLFLSVLAKPTFAEMFIPAVALVMLGEWIARIVKKDGSAAPYFRQCLSMLLCSLPALAYMVLQFTLYFILGGSYGSEGGLVITKFLEVWGMYSENVGLSVLLGMAFPLFIVLINVRYFLKDDLGRLALACYGVGFLEAALLGESTVLSFGDFIWPLMSAMLVMWVVSVLRLLVLERTQADTGLRRNLLNIAWSLFFLHVLCGYLYFKDMMQEVY